MAPQERTELVQHLERGRQEFLAAIDGLTDAQAKAHPDPARWSVLDCVEHVTIVEQRFLGFLENAEKLDSPRIDKEKEARLLATVPDRSARFQAPETTRPSGRFASLEQAREHFDIGRARSIQFAQERCDDLYRMQAMHQRLGPLNGVEYLILIAQHARRHAEQIREARAALQES